MLFSCSETKQGDLLEIPVDIHKNDLLSLQEITEEIIAIELELTDESVFSPNYIQNITLSESEVFIAGMQKIYVFSKDGQFIRTIGSTGQGPGEYHRISKIALDEKNRRLFISSSKKIVSYDINGNFLKETKVLSGEIKDINYINEELLLLVENVYDDNKEVYYSRPTLYRLNDELRTVDSCTIMNYRYASSQLWFHKDFILKEGKSVFLYYGDFAMQFGNDLVEKVFSDTLYRIENKYIVPELKLKFNSNGVSNFIHLFNIYRSSRYVFVIYKNANSPGTTAYYFCYDTKTGKGYNMQDGFTDDINGIDKRVSIRPFNHDTEMFYYLHTHIKSGDLEEPNPTLYIGKLKK